MSVSVFNSARRRGRAIVAHTEPAIPKRRLPRLALTLAVMRDALNRSRRAAARAGGCAVLVRLTQGERKALAALLAKESELDCVHWTTTSECTGKVFAGWIHEVRETLYREMLPRASRDLGAVVPDLTGQKEQVTA